MQAKPLSARKQKAVEALVAHAAANVTSVVNRASQAVDVVFWMPNQVTKTAGMAAAQTKSLVFEAVADQRHETSPKLSPSAQGL